MVKTAPVSKKFAKYNAERDELNNLGYEVLKSHDNTYHILVKAPNGDKVDYYSTTETFIFRKERSKGKGYKKLIGIFEGMKAFEEANSQSMKGYIESCKNSKFISDRNGIKESNHRIQDSLNSTSQIVIISPSGELVDYYSTTETFIFRTSRAKGKGYRSLLNVLNRMRELNFGSAQSLNFHLREERSLIKEASPQSLLESIAMKILRKRGYRVYE